MSSIKAKELEQAVKVVNRQLQDAGIYKEVILEKDMGGYSLGIAKVSRAYSGWDKSLRAGRTRQEMLNYLEGLSQGLEFVPDRDIE